MTGTGNLDEDVSGANFDLEMNTSEDMSGANSDLETNTNDGEASVSSREDRHSRLASVEMHDCGCSCSQHEPNLPSGLHVHYFPQLGT